MNSLNIGSLITGVLLLLLVGNVIALVHVIKTRPDAFVAASKQSKKFWLWLIIGSLVVTQIFGLFSMLGIVGIIAVIVYLVDVKPAINEILRRPRY
ncbi:MAG: hypothetical protein JW384_01522 [Nitrosomonadaceae bacterium]|nr:hypothetical protein [Nitrosomonadaceae bacterium]